MTWTIRASSPARTYGGEAADALPARGALGSRLREHVENGEITVLTGFSVQAITAGPDGVEVSDGAHTVTVDRIVSATGFRPDHSIVSELRLDLDPIMGSTRALAPLIDPNEHSCGTVPSHGVDELTHPEPGYYAIGSKSYGRAPTFLMATGYERARSVVDAAAAARQRDHEIHRLRSSLQAARLQRHQLQDQLDAAATVIAALTNENAALRRQAMTPPARIVPLFSDQGR